MAFETQVQLGQMVPEQITVQTFSQFSQGWDISDVDPTRAGPVGLRAVLSVDFDLSPDVGLGDSLLLGDVLEFDAMGAFSGTLGGFSCVNGSCSGTNADLSGLNVTSGRVFGDVVGDFVGGSANTTSFIGFDGGAQYSGMAYTSAVDAVIDGTVDFALQSNEGTVTVSAVPEAASSGLLLAAALAAAFLFPRSR